MASFFRQQKMQAFFFFFFIFNISLCVCKNKRDPLMQKDPKRKEKKPFLIETRKIESTDRPAQPVDMPCHAMICRSK